MPKTKTIKKEKKTQESTGTPVTWETLGTLLFLAAIIFGIGAIGWNIGWNKGYNDGISDTNQSKISFTAPSLTPYQ